MLSLPSFADCPVSDLWLIVYVYSFLSDTQGLQKDCLANFNPLVPNSEKVMEGHIAHTSWCFTAICFHNYVITNIIPLPLHVSHFPVILANFVPIIIRKYVCIFSRIYHSGDRLYSSLELMSLFWLCTPALRLVTFSVHSSSIHFPFYTFFYYDSLLSHSAVLHHVHSAVLHDLHSAVLHHVHLAVLHSAVLYHQYLAVLYLHTAVIHYLLSALLHYLIYALHYLNFAVPHYLTDFSPSPTFSWHTTVTLGCWIRFALSLLNSGQTCLWTPGKALIVSPCFFLFSD